MSVEKQRFHFRTVLSVSTERFLCEQVSKDDNGIGQFYEILNWMTQDDLCTHQLPRAIGECKPWLLRWFPELEIANQNLDLLDSLLSAYEPSRACDKWCELMLSSGIKEWYDVPKIPADDHVKKDAYDELVEMRGTDEGILTVDVSDDAP